MRILQSLLLIALVSISYIGFAQKKDVFVDRQGILRWGDTKEEVQGFGVNYTVPFAHAYRSAKKLGVDHKKAIDNDVYHFKRLGFDLYRVHVWDTEISDTLGNLLVNEHLELFDYLLSKLQENGINYVVTPIAFWGNGWPERDEPTPGFAYKYGKGDCLTNPEAIKAQENYLFQFLNHVNSFTGIAYKSDPNLIAFEVSNEPHHGGAPDLVESYIKKMVKSMKKTGTKKPIFYNVSHSIQFAENYFNSNIDGGTFQWYPTGLTYQRELQGNLLPNVDRYHIPFDDIIKKNKAAKLVYEFDAADVGRTYMYPAMARSFREAGIQIATHFAYDPTFLAYANTEYNTHYMNLPYTPGKAISLMIAGKVFHEMPMYKSYGRYPQNTQFGHVSVSYEDDLTEYLSDDTFIYSNNTDTKAESLEDISHIYGVGNSPYVNYEGKGAYFIDQLEDGIWRLEVMPDAVWTSNPFGKNSLDRKVAEIVWGTWKMKINHSKLGNVFLVKGINEGNQYSTKAENAEFEIKPGTYMIVREGASSGINISDLDRRFYAPETTLDETIVIHDPITQLTSGTALTISAMVLSPDKVDRVQASVRNGFTFRSIEMNHVGGYEYQASLPSELLSPGNIEYNIIVTTDSISATFPGAIAGQPRDWDFYSAENYSTRVYNNEDPIYLFNAYTDSDLLMRQWTRGLRSVMLPEPNKSEYEVNLNNLERPHNDYSFRHAFAQQLKGRMESFKGKQELVVRGRSLNDKNCMLQVSLLMSNGASYGAILELSPDKQDYKIAISDLKLVPTVTLPRPYPTFLDYYTLTEYGGDFNLSNSEALVFSIGPGIDPSEYNSSHGIAIESVRIE